MNPGPGAAEEMMGIAELEDLIAGLGEPERALIGKIFDVRTSISSLVYPEIPDVVRRYGERAKVERQKIVKVTNLVTYEGALFNELRSRRPFQTEEALEIEKIINDTTNCFFCGPDAVRATPGDTFIEGGRVDMANCFSASNPGKYDGYHGLVIFKDHSPYSFQNFPEYLECALEWAHAARVRDFSARYFFFMWNCLWKAGGSIIHGHTQMSLTKGLHYGKIEQLLKASKDYSKDYFEDLFKAHKALGLGFESGSARVMAYLTPVKEKETLIIARDLDGVKNAVPKILKCFYSRLGVRSFNLAIICSPSAVFSEATFADRDEENSKWQGFPILVRIVDRGSLENRTADVGAMELYASSVISSDPFNVARELKSEFGLGAN